jgi:hypothetical protein
VFLVTGVQVLPVAAPEEVSSRTVTALTLCKSVSTTRDAIAHSAHKTWVTISVLAPSALTNKQLTRGIDDENSLTTTELNIFQV